MSPIDYTIDIASPFEAGLQGLRFGSAINQADTLKQLRAQQVQQSELATQAARSQEERQAALNQALMGLRDNPNPTARDFANVSMFLPEKQAESLRADFAMMNEDRKRNELRFGGQVVAAINSGRLDSAKGLLQLREKAEQDPQRKKAYQDIRALIDVNPEAASMMGASILSALPGGPEMMESVAKLRRDPVELRTAQAAATTAEAEAATARAREQAELQSAQWDAGQKAQALVQAGRIAPIEVEQAKAELQDTLSQIDERAKRLGLDRDKIAMDAAQRLQELNNQSRVQLDTDARKLVNDAATSSVTATSFAGKLSDLADRIDRLGGGWGNVGSVSGFFARATGNEGEWRSTRDEYTRLRNSLAMQSLPPGPATDKDIELAMKSFPGENAGAGYVSSFLRGMAKLKRIDGLTDDAKSEWVANVGSLAPAPTDLNVGGEHVTAGETFPQFIDRFVARISSEMQDIEEARTANEQQAQDAGMAELMRDRAEQREQQQSVQRPLFSPSRLGAPSGQSSQGVR